MQKKLVLLLTFLTFITFCSSQSKEFSYEKLFESQAHSVEKNDLIELKRISKIHRAKAFDEDNIYQWVMSHYYTVLNEKLEIALNCADSVITTTKNSQQPFYTAEVLLWKGHRQYESGLYYDALKTYIEVLDLSEITGSKSQKRDAMLTIAAIKNMHGFELEALDIYKKAFEETKSLDLNLFENLETQYLLLNNIGLGFLRLKSIDSSRIYISQGYNLSLLNKNTIWSRNFVLDNAQIDYYDGNYLKCRDSLLKYIEYIDKEEIPDKFYYLGMVAFKLGDSIKGLNYLRSIDSLISISNKPIDEIKSVYQNLLIQATKEDNKVKQLEYINKLIHFDSILNTNKFGTNNLETVGFDLPLLKKEKKNLQSKLKENSLLLKVSLFFTFGLFIILIFWIVRYRKTKQRIKFLMLNEAIPLKPDENLEADKSEVSAEIKYLIQIGLADFEDNLLFLDPDITQESLAKEIGTNSTYLSKVVNHSKGVNFSNYIKDLRITYAINDLKNNPRKALKYSIRGLAESYGFKSSDSFSRALKIKTKVGASIFVKTIAQLNDNL